MRWQDILIADPAIMHGATCFRGTRVPVPVVLDNLAAGMPPAELHAQHPTLPPDAVPAALAYAADLARERVIPIPA